MPISSMCLQILIPSKVVSIAINCDTVLVQPGMYVENINFNGKNIAVGSLTLTTGDTAYISQTVIDGDSSGSVVRFENDEDSTAWLCGFTITKGYGRPLDGAGIYVNNSSPRLSQLLIKNNMGSTCELCARSYGGGIYFENSSSKLNDLIIMNNSSDKGGGIYCINSDITLTNVLVSENNAFWGWGGGAGDGGGIDFNNSHAILVNVIIVGNYAITGGGMSSINSNPNLFNVTIKENFAEVVGGGMYIYGNPAPVFDPVNKNSIFFNDAYNVENEIIGMDLFIGDSLNNVSVVLDTFTVLNPNDYYAHPINQFTFNIQNAKVEPIYSDLYVNPNGNNNNSGLTSADPLKTIDYAFRKILTDSLNPHTIYLANGRYSPSATGERYPLYMRGYISICGETMAGVILDAENISNIMEFEQDRGNTIENLTITGGLADRGGAIYCSRSNPHFSNLLITNNTAIHTGGGVAISTGLNWQAEETNPTFSNVTVSNNTSYDNGGGISCTHSTSRLINSIIWNNIPENIFGGGDTLNAFYSDIQGGWSGIGNINADPMFVDTANGNYRLQAGSPCIDAGIQDTMIIYNNGQDTLIVPPIPYLGSAPDMGAYEYDPTVALPTQSEEEITGLFSLHQNYPNPFNPTTNIEFSLPQSEFVTLKVYNILGQEVATLVSERLPAGQYKYDWDASSLASGVYLYRIQASEYVDAKKMILLR